MSNRSSIKIVYDDLPKVVVKLRKGAAMKTKQTVEDIRDTAKQIVPVDTGQLRDSIVVIQTGPTEWTVQPLAEYALFVELGTVNSPAQPYMQPAVAQHRETFFNSMKKVID